MSGNAQCHRGLQHGREHGALSDYVLTALAESVAFDEAVRDEMAAADLFWVAADMARAALDASQDVPSIDLADAPCTIGLMAMAEPLPAWGTFVGGSMALRGPDHVIEHTDPVPVDAVAWRTHRDQIHVHLMCKASRLPAPMYLHEPPLVPFVRLKVPIPHDFSSRAGLIDVAGHAVDDTEWVGAAAFLAAAWTMMQQPTVALRRTLDTRGSTTRRSATSPTEDTSRRVTVIDLRPARYVRDDGEDSAGSGRRLKTRHLVRGHWTNQPYGKGREKRRKQWIASYIRGPEGAPWSGSETVYAWRR